MAEQRRRIPEPVPRPSVYHAEQERYERYLSEEGVRVTARLLDPSDGDITKREFVVISCTSYGILSKTTYVPAEVGMAAFSLELGLLDNYASLIDPGRVRPEQQYDTRQASKALGLPCPPYSEALRNYEDIWENIETFMARHKSAPGNNYLFCSRNEIPVVQSCLELLARAAATESDLQLLPLGILFRRFEQVGRSVHAIDQDLGRRPEVANGLPTGLAASLPPAPFTWDVATRTMVPLPVGPRVPIPIHPRDEELFRNGKAAEEFLDRWRPELSDVELACPHHMMNTVGLELCPLNLVNKRVFQMIDHLYIYFGITAVEGLHYPLVDKEEERHRRRRGLIQWGNTGYKGLEGFMDSAYTHMDMV